MKFKKMIAVLLTLCMALALLPRAVLAAETEAVPMYRLYNPNSGEHFYTGSVEERDNLVSVGWNYEGVAWNAPVKSGTPVHRVFNPNSGDHHYTMSMEEVENLKAIGWQYEGVCWNSAAGGSPQYRLYNPNADLGSHHYTSSVEERENLVSLGWIFEGIGWYGVLPEGHVHSYDSMVIEPTCTEKGYTLWYCVCGDSYTDNEVGTKDHKYTSKVTEPACKTDGYTTFTCACGDSYTDNVVSAPGHSYTVTVVERTVTEAGYTQHTCTVCGYSFIEKYAPPKGYDEDTCPGHMYPEWNSYVVSPTLISEGYTIYRCQYCYKGYKADFVPKLSEPVEHTGYHTIDPDIVEYGDFYLARCICGGGYTSEISTEDAVAHVEEMIPVHLADLDTYGHSDHYLDIYYTSPIRNAVGPHTYDCTVCGQTVTDDSTFLTNTNIPPTE